MSSIINSIEALSETQKKTSNITKDKYKPITRNPSKSKFLQSNDIYYSSNQLTSRNTNNKISKHNSSHSKNNLSLIKNFDYVSRNKNKNNSNHVPLSCPRNYSSYRDETQNNNDTISPKEQIIFGIIYSNVLVLALVLFSEIIKII